MFPHGLTCAGRVAAYQTSDAIRTATIAWTRVHAIIKSITCAKGRLKWRRSDDLPCATWQPEKLPIVIKSKGLEMIAITQYASDDRDCSQSRSVDLHQTDAMGAPCGSRSNLHPTATMKHDPPLFVMISGASDFNPTATMKHDPPLFVMISGASDFNPTAQTDRGRTPRSRRDRAAIRELPWWNCRQSIGRRSTDGQDHDLGPIVAKMRLIWSQIQADFSRNWSHDAAPKESLTRRPQTTPTTASIGHDLRANFPL